MPANPTNRASETSSHPRNTKTIFNRLSRLEVSIIYLICASVIFSIWEDSRSIALISQGKESPLNSTSRVDGGTSALVLPTYTARLAREAVRPSSWTCGRDESTLTNTTDTDRSFFAFVHIFKTAGSTLRHFFREYATTCRKTWVCLVECAAVKPSSIQRGEYWDPCKVKEVTDGRRDGQGFSRVKNSVLEQHVDVLGGHFRIGSADYLFRGQSTQATSPSSQSVRYIVFLREPKARFVSARLFNDKKTRRKTNDWEDEDFSLENVVNRIKKQVLDGRHKNEYWLQIEKYLHTPDQTEMGDLLLQHHNKSDHQGIAELKTRLMIQNLVEYNPIVGMTEQMGQSMVILRHELLNQTVGEVQEDIHEIFDRYTPSTSNSSSSGVMKNPSQFGEVSTSSVLLELAKDKHFVSFFDEFVKYERMVTDFGWQMHNMQYSAVVETNSKASAESVR